MTNKNISMHGEALEPVPDYQQHTSYENENQPLLASNKGRQVHTWSNMHHSVSLKNNNTPNSTFETKARETRGRKTI